MREEWSILSNYEKINEGGYKIICLDMKIGAREKCVLVIYVYLGCYSHFVPHFMRLTSFGNGLNGKQ